ncbi:MAG: hypothetical protein V1809_13380 [Planctomycetota bacterium]
MRVALLIFLGAALAVGAFAGDGSPPSPPVAESPSSAPAAEGSVRAIEGDVENLRRLSFGGKHPAVNEITRQELPALLERLLREELPPEKLGSYEEALRAFGFLPPGTRLMDILRRLLESEVAGVYDPSRRTLYVVAGGARPNPMEETLRALGVEMKTIILSHELEHALQDVNFDLGALRKAVRGSEDRELAAASVIEGDATFLMTLHAVRTVATRPWAGILGKKKSEDVFPLILPILTEMLSRVDFDAGVEEAMRGEGLGDVPRYLRESLFVPYIAGLKFVMDAWRRGGWTNVNGLFRSPPASMEQVLHPEKYFDRPDAPRRMSLSLRPAVSATFSRRPPPAARGAVGDDENPVAGGPWGELGVRVFLEDRGVPRAEAATAAAGWDGDAFLVVGNKKKRGFLWAILWDSETDRTEFKNALARHYPKTVVEEDGEMIWVAEGISRREFDVLRRRTRIVRDPSSPVSVGAPGIPR